MNILTGIIVIGTAYMAIGVLYLCLRERVRELNLGGILDPVIWWLPEIYTGKLSGTRWRTNPIDIVIGIALAICLFTPIINLGITVWK